MLVVMLKICRLEDQVKDKFAERIQKRGKIFGNTKKLCGKYTKMLITLYTSDDILGTLIKIYQTAFHSFESKDSQSKVLTAKSSVGLNFHQEIRQKR